MHCYYTDSCLLSIFDSALYDNCDMATFGLYIGCPLTAIPLFVGIRDP